MENEMNDLLPQFKCHLEERAGIIYSKHDPGMLAIGINERCRYLGCKDKSEYLEILRNPLKGEKELKALLDIITIKETSFFRNADHFRILRERVVPGMLEQKRASRESGRSRRPVIKIWSAGCATGEEAYSLAILLLYMGLPEKGYDIKVYGTDISPKALEYAMRGEYPAESVSVLPAMVKEGFFEKKGEGYSVKEEVRSSVTFEEYNLVLTSLPRWASDIDIIFCQNVLIYLSPRGYSQCLDNLYNALSKDGYLFLGFTEGALARRSSFSTVDIDGIYIYRKQGVKPTKSGGSQAKGRTDVSRSAYGAGDAYISGSALRSKEKLKFQVFKDIIMPEGIFSVSGLPKRGGALSEGDISKAEDIFSKSDPSNTGRFSSGRGLSNRSRVSSGGDPSKAGTISLESDPSKAEMKGSLITPDSFCFQMEYFINISDIPEIGRLLKLGIESLYYDPDVREIVDRGIQTLLNLQRYAEVEAICMKIMEKDPLRPYPYKAIGLVYYGRGRYGKAEEYLRKALYLAPDNLLAHLYLGIIAERKGSTRRFRAELSHVLSLLSSGASIGAHSGLSEDELLSFCMEKLYSANEN